MTVYGVSIAIPQPYDARLEEVRVQVGDPFAGKVPAHVTLMPPTEIADEDVEEFRGHLEEVAAAYEPFTMMLRGTGTFRPVSPVVFVAMAMGIPQCEVLETDVRGGPIDRDLEFNYHPHVTIAHGVDDAALDHAFTALADFTATFEVDGFDLYEQGDDDVWRSVRHFAFGVG